MACCPNGIYRPLIIDCGGNVVNLPPGAAIGGQFVSGAVAGSVTPGSTDNAIVRADGTTNDTVQGSDAIIDDNGRIGLGGVTAPNALIEGEGTAGSTEIRLSRISADTGSPRIRFRKARGTPGSEADVASGDIIGTFTFHTYRNGAYQGADSPASCMFFAEVTGTPATNSVPGDVVFNTTDVGQTANSNAVRISHEAALFIYNSPSNDTPTTLPTNAAGLFSKDADAQLYGIDESGVVWQLTGYGALESDGMYHVPVTNDAGRPAAGTAGRLFFNTTDGNLNIDDGTNWILPDGTTT